MRFAAQSPSRHVITQLPDYVAGTLGVAASRRVRTHLDRCAACREELQVWEHIATATQTAGDVTFAPSAALLARVWDEIDAPEPTAILRLSSFSARYRHRWQVAWRQMSLLNPVIWIACLAAIIAVTYVASQQSIAENSDLVLSAGLPLISAVGITFLYGSEIDPSLELAVATPTSPRWIFFSRWMLSFGYNLVLSLAATTALAAWQGQSLWALVSLWLGPMALLATLSALIAALLNPAVAALSAFIVWTTRFIQFGNTITVLLAAPPRWQTNPAILLLAVVLLVLALYVAGRREHFA